MTLLYSKLAEVYHEMYQHVFDYDQEFLYYDALLKKHRCRNILEIGCGSGMLAQRFLKEGYSYLGLDLHEEMLAIARREAGQACFVQGDMRNLSLDGPFDAVLITGRSLAYIPDNKGILDTFAGIHRVLKEDGMFAFGVFEAHGIFNHFEDTEQTIHLKNKMIRRVNHLSKNLETGWTYDWNAKYFIEENGGYTEYIDITTLRAFTRDEISLFLKLTGFQIREILEEEKLLNLVAKKL